jgi:hypothetical protein
VFEMQENHDSGNQAARRFHGGDDSASLLRSRKRHEFELEFAPPDPGLRLPAKKKVVLSILSGPSKGEAHTLTKPRIVVGRQGADIALNDPEVSRYHCLLEVRDTHIHLKDTDSTNGTFYQEERVRVAMLQDGTEFRIGESLIRVDFQAK